MDDSTLIGVLVDPQLATTLSLAQWNRLLPEARGHAMLGLLARRLADLGLWNRLPEPVIAHLQSALIIAEGHQRMVSWEVNRIQRALADTGVTPILLKGAAYLLRGLPMAQGRLVSDVDILVSEDALESVEQALIDQGWTALKQDDYDQQYYRRWMHELPPLRHKLRGTVVDVHHNILPRTSRLCPDSLRLREASEVLAPGIHVLCPADMVIHSAVHGFHDGEFANSLRDLLDLHDLLVHFGADDAFWPELATRARDLGLQRPLSYGLRYTARFLGTPISSSVVEALEGSGPGAVARAAMDHLLPYTLPPANSSPVLAPIARKLLYMRSHWLRMPPGMLMRHLAIKALRYSGLPAATGRTK